MSYTKLSKSDYGSNISIIRYTYSTDDQPEDQVTIFQTNADKFIPDDSEFDEDWNVSAYIDEYLSFFDFDSEEEKNYTRDALWSCKLRYLADDSYTAWQEAQSSN